MDNQKVPDPAPEKWNKRVKQWHPVVPGSRFTQEMVTAVLPNRIDVGESIIKGEFVKDPNYQPIGNVAVPSCNIPCEAGSRYRPRLEATCM